MALEEGSLSYLTWMYQWGGRDDIVLQEEDSDQQWQYTKKKIENLFKSAKKDNPHERWLEIWVKGGCEEEDDWWSQPDCFALVLFFNAILKPFTNSACM